MVRLMVRGMRMVDPCQWAGGDVFFSILHRIQWENCSKVGGIWAVMPLNQLVFISCLSTDSEVFPYIIRLPCYLRSQIITPT